MSEKRLILNVETMTCNHCTNFVKNTLNELNGVINTEMSLQDGTATVTFDPELIGADAIAGSLDDTPYRVVKMAELN
ncbi:MAG TPA: cation transporter [Chitinophagales bacterium]|nr:cation transporter [Chitinophagales bacterium]HRK28014.1 cation transporter [Chitinophagales bacterium]